ncbi:nicotinamide-nucleotide amidase [Vibrio sp.]|nr:nicotinamide-nucleotide amidase [Vibrio sp.]
MQRLNEQVGQALKDSQHVLVTAESCTGGGISTAITDVAGSSEWFDRAFITYSNAAKQEMLGVSKQTLDQFGAVSEETVKAMVQGALRHSNGTIAVSVSGVAGPGGGSKEKPVGTVWFAWGDNNDWNTTEKKQFIGDRTAVRIQAIDYALQKIYLYLKELK